MTKILSFNEWDRSSKIYEDVHPKVFAALRRAPEKVFTGVQDAARELGHESGLIGHGASGSSRGVFHTTKGHTINLDGKETKVDTILKSTLKRKSLVKGKQTGQRQNEVESAAHIQKFATVVRDGTGGYKTNPHGVIPPVYEIGKKSKWLHAGAARDVSHREFRELTQTKEHPEGLSASEVSDAARHVANGNSHPKENHPLVQKMARFIKATGVADMHQDNWGVWEHPHTGERHLVLRDAGYDSSMRKEYGWGYSAGSHDMKTPQQVTKQQDEPKAPRRPRDAKGPQVGDQLGLKMRVPKGGAEKNKAVQKAAAQGTITKYDHHMINQKAEKITHKPNTSELNADRWNDNIGAHTFLAKQKVYNERMPNHTDIDNAKRMKNWKKKHYVLNAPKQPTTSELNPDNKPSTAEYNKRRVDVAAEKLRINKAAGYDRVDTREVMHRIPVPKYKGK
jgi:hypothetical protein